MKSAVAVITARGGSKRIPRKNIKDFCGKPIIAYSIEAAVKSNCFDEVMVSTDDEEIAEIAKQYGAKVPFMRSRETSDDYATMRDVLIEVIEKYKEVGREFEYIVCIYPTAPFVTSEKIKEALRILDKEKCTEVLPIVKFSFPVQRAYVLRNGHAEYRWKDYENCRSQDLEPFYHDAGQFYCYDIAKYIENDEVIMNDVFPIIVSELEVQDIDNQEDWAIAELKYKNMKKDN